MDLLHMGPLIATTRGTVVIALSMTLTALAMTPGVGDSYPDCPCFGTLEYWDLPHVDPRNAITSGTAGRTSVLTTWPSKSGPTDHHNYDFLKYLNLVSKIVSKIDIKTFQNPNSESLDHSRFLSHYKFIENSHKYNIINQLDDKCCKLVGILVNDQCR